LQTKRKNIVFRPHQLQKQARKTTTGNGPFGKVRGRREKYFHCGRVCVCACGKV